jgi:hypothetical protein
MGFWHKEAFILTLRIEGRSDVGKLQEARHKGFSVNSLVRHRPRAASAFGGLLHDQNQRQACGEHDRQKKEDVDITHHGGLLLDHAEESGGGLFGGGGGVHAANQQITQLDI